MYNYKSSNDACIKVYDNMNKASKPYRAKNMIVQKSEINSQNQNINQPIIPDVAQPQIEEPPSPNAQPITEVEPPIVDETTGEVETNLENEEELKTGYISVGVFTALQALPVPDAVVTIYLINSDGEEEALYILVTDENGRIPLVELPVSYNPDNPLVSSEYYFTSYNLRVQAINYYTVNVLDVRIFPDVTTVYKIDLIPVMLGSPSGEREQTIVIPSSPIDESNE